jgi:hypothetical protein
MTALRIALLLLLAAPLVAAQTPRSAEPACTTDDCDGSPSTRATDYNSSRSNRTTSSAMPTCPGDSCDDLPWVEYPTATAASFFDAVTRTSPTSRGAGDDTGTDPTPIYMTLAVSIDGAPAPGATVTVSPACGRPLLRAYANASGHVWLALPGTEDAAWRLAVRTSGGDYQDGSDLILRKRPGRGSVEAAQGGTAVCLQPVNRASGAIAGICVGRDAASGLPTGRR